MNNDDVRELVGRGGDASHEIFTKLTSLENVFTAWNEFQTGKACRRDVQQFAFHLEDNLFALHEDLQSGRYRHGQYTSFLLHDPKLRYIQKAAVRDRIVHHAVTRVLTPLLDSTFINNSYSNRKGKGSHAAVRRFRFCAWKLSRNNTKTVWVLQCDIRKFFASVDHTILLSLLAQRIHDGKAMNLLEEIIRSVNREQGKGIPLGNLTSQLFSNIYLHPLDWYVQQTLGVHTYIRYADDFMLVDCSKALLQSIIPLIETFVQDKLQLQLHPQKVTLKKWHQGIDFLGYVSFPHHTVLRTKTKKRLLKKVQRKYYQVQQGIVLPQSLHQTLQSYLGVLGHCRGRRIQEELETYGNNLPAQR